MNTNRLDNNQHHGLNNREYGHIEGRRDRNLRHFNLGTLIRVTALASLAFLYRYWEGASSISDRRIMNYIPDDFNHCPPTSFSNAICRLTAIFPFNAKESELLLDGTRDGCLYQVCSAIAGCGDINAKDEKGQTPLHNAILRGDREQVETLLFHGASVQDKTLAEMAISHHRFNILKLLIDRGGSISNDIFKHINWRLSDEGSHFNPVEAHIESLRYLLETRKNIDVNQASESNGKTPLMVAVTENSKELFDLFFHHGADINGIGFQVNSRSAPVGDYNDLLRNKNPIFEAVKMGSIDWVRTVVAHGADLNREAFQLLLAAVWSHSYEVVDYLIEYAPSIFLDEVRGYPAFISEAMAIGNEKIVEVLLKHGAPLSKDQGNIREGSVKWNIFFLAARSGSLNMLKMISDREPIPLKTSIDRFALLLGGTRSKSLEMVRYLVEELGLDPARSLPPEDGHLYPSFLYNAAKSGSLEVVKYLVEECGVDVHAKSDSYGLNARSAARLEMPEGYEAIDQYLEGKGVQSEDLREAQGIITALYDPFGRS